ncbi:hypothetical protein ACOSQ4_032483 [Xanthoceras sorbifolium]
MIIFMFSLAASLCTAISSFNNQTDQIALFAFKNSITEDPLGALSSWNNSVNVCQWSGVQCGNRHQRVVELDLRFQRLAGSISPSIGNLSFLRSIYLQDNRFRGDIPQEISHLPRLQNLNFTNNTLQGEIPSNLIPAAFGSLSKLTSLSLFSNNLHGTIPTSFGNLSLLERLSLGTNNLEGTIPESIGHLTNLQYLGIGVNEISGTVPPSLDNISTLTDLVIPSNQLTGSLPPDIGFTLSSLRIISTGGNQFTGRFPTSFSNASGMRILDLSESGLFGPIPVDIGRRMTDLRWLNFGDNNLGTGVAGDTSFVDSLTNCTSLQILGLYSNGFGGVLPNSFKNLSTQLRLLEAGGNQFVGNIPAGLSNFVNLVDLGLEQNFLSGSIPFSIGKLQKLQELSLGRNRLSGSIPESISNLTQLFQLNLEDNNLTGSFPQSLEYIRGLQIFNLSHNNLAGPVPKTIAFFSSLSSINLAHNSFNGSLPLEIGTLNNLEELDISNNDLSGEVPSTLGSCLRLEHLLLGSNLFHGSIPSSFGALKGLVDMDLSHNNLSGTIPADLETLPFLEKLNLSFNNLEGNVPTKGAFTNTSVISIVGNRNLCGGVPELHLPTCAIQESNKNNRLGSKVIIIIVTLGVCLVLILLFVAIYWKRKPRKVSSPSPLREGFFRVSYDELLKATGGFSSTNLLGAGSFGSVYKGMLHKDDKPVAVKVFNLDKLGASKSFIAECETLRRMRHRNLLKIITACSSINFEGSDFKALVFKFMPNGNLESWLHPSEDTTMKLNLTQRLNIAIDVVSALEYLHHHCETPIVHCDLKPSNVLLDEDMIAHVGDFGLAKFLTINLSNPINRQTNSIAIKGSIGYVAPEYGMGASASKQGDIYSGILLLEILIGKRPTDEIFKDGLSLHSFCKMALPDRVMEIADSCLLIPEDNLNDQTNRNRNAEIEECMKFKMRECLISLVRIGVACSTEAPSERMGLSEVVMELNAIKQVFLGGGIHGERRIRIQLASQGTSNNV